MAIITFIILTVALVLIGIGFAIGLLASVIATILLALGVISTSTLVGIRTGRPAAGFRAFFIQCGILAGIPAGAACVWIAHSFFQAYGDGWPILIYGAIGGAIGGLCIALSLDFITRRLATWASGRVSPGILKSRAAAQLPPSR